MTDQPRNRIEAVIGTPAQRLEKELELLKYEFLLAQMNTQRANEENLNHPPPGHRLTTLEWRPFPGNGPLPRSYPKDMTNEDHEGFMSYITKRKSLLQPQQ